MYGLFVCNISIAGTFDKKITGKAKEEYEGELHERHEGIYYLYNANHTHLKELTGFTDYVCPVTPARGTSQACVTAEEV